MKKEAMRVAAGLVAAVGLSGCLTYEGPGALTYTAIRERQEANKKIVAVGGGVRETSFFGAAKELVREEPGWMAFRAGGDIATGWLVYDSGKRWIDDQRDKDDYVEVKQPPPQEPPTMQVNGDVYFLGGNGSITHTSHNGE